MHVNGRVSRLIYAVAMSVFALNTASAGVVTLQSHDKSMSISGELISFDGLLYTIKGNLGEVEIDASMVTCTSGDCPASLDETKFTIAGSNVFGTGLMPSLVEYFALVKDMNPIELLDDNPLETTFTLESNIDETFVDISILSNGTEMAFEALISKSAALGIISNNLTFENTSPSNLAASNPMQATQNNLVALDGVAIVTSHNNPVDALTLDQIARIFSGQISNWNEVGGVDAAISVKTLDSTSNLTKRFIEAVMQPAGKIIAPNASQFEDNRQLTMAVSEDPNAIGFASYAFSARTKIVALRGSCGIEVKPTQFTLRTQEYPLSQQLHIIHMDGEQTEMTKDFLQFLNTDEARMAVHHAGFVSTSIAEQKLLGHWGRLLNSVFAGQGDRLSSETQAFINDFRDARRLSSTFRFNFASSKLGDENVGGIMLLSEYIRANYTPNSAIIVAGFTGSRGPESANAAISARAAQMVAQLLSKELTGTGIRVESAGYGEVSPLICDDSANAERTNQRVEIWVRSTRP